MWSQFKEALAQHVDDIEAVLLTNEGACTDEVVKLESFVGIKLPDDFRNFLALHDGQKATGEFSFGVQFYSVSQMLKWSKHQVSENQYSNDRRPNEKVSSRIKQDQNWRRGWILFAGDCVDHWVMDLDPSPEGIFGQIFEFDEYHCINRIVADSFTHLIEQATTILQSEKLSSGLPLRFEFD